MQISKHTSDSKIPTHVITSRSRSCILSAFCRKRDELQFIIFVLKSTLSWHYKTWNSKNNPVMTHVAVTWCITKQMLPCLTWSPSRGGALSAATLHHVAQVFWLHPSVSNNVAGQAMFNRAVPWWICCWNPFVVLSTKGCQTMPAMTPWGTVISLKDSFGVAPILSRFVRKNLFLTKQGDKIKSKVLIPHTVGQWGFIHHPWWLKDIKIN